MPVKILAICGSPVKGGNAEAYTKEALKGAQEVPDVETELVLLSEWYDTLKGCSHCNYCATKQKPDRFCAIKDPMTEVYPKLLEADGIIFSSPAYATRVTGLMANFMDRMRPLYHGKLYIGSLHNKVGAGLCVAFGRHCGVETTQLSIVQALLLWGIIPCSVGLWGPYGAAGLSSYGGEGKVDREDKHAVFKDQYGVKQGKIVCKEVAERAKLVRAGNQALGIEKKFLNIYREAVGKG